ncbi:hypothetical protein KZX47_05910 [Thermus sp. SYSU G05001]|uniref:Uncharacterized protein n=1 Tax=Thermus brevis TaxID=2862456 RepID=A0ABS6ZX98_9DEIN|nr:hypothetical protein [Thermus brevis]MBW6394687.1 hypothetical protein [Thermus brevis]
MGQDLEDGFLVPVERVEVFLPFNGFFQSFVHRMDLVFVLLAEGDFFPEGVQGEDAKPFPLGSDRRREDASQAHLKEGL